MGKIFVSASKLAFLTITLAACLGFFKGHLSEENFMILAGSAFSFYFAHKPTDNNNEINK